MKQSVAHFIRKSAPVTLAASRLTDEAWETKHNPNFTDPNPPWKFGFWKSHSKNFRDPYDCYVQCQDCLDRGIRAGLVDTNQVACHYKVKNALISHTCEMGFDRLANDTDEYWAFELAGLGRPWWVLHPPS
ncbi:MAG: hypothetical protein LQ348_002594 [Seirophora lacunosa]|nr:MAG: hypothetical protein LQ348_002594 [Seirophora lacunosa]